MGSRNRKDVSSRLSRPTDAHFLFRGVPFTFNKELMAARSAKLAALLTERSREDQLSHFLRDIPADPHTFELVARFCHGFEFQLSTENVVPLACLAYYLEMTEKHSPNNLLRKTLSFFEKKVLTSWNHTIKALRNTEQSRKLAESLGLVDACLESIVLKALADPCLVGEPFKKTVREEDLEDKYKPNARRMLFVLDWKSEDLTTLPLRLYEPLVHAMTQRGVPSEHIAASIYSYANKWVFSSTERGEHVSVFKRNSQREVIEAVGRLFPDEIGVLQCTQLTELLRFAITLEASSDCRNGLETKIGKQLDQATVQDLLIPSQVCAKEVQYDVECVRRILKHFYANYTSEDMSGLVNVAVLIEELLIEVASDIDLKMHTFIDLAEMSISASLAPRRSSDGIYRAIDVYLDKHGYLTEAEREEVCQVLDCQKLSAEACQHAAQNQRLPLRIVVQVLFMGQLQIRDMIPQVSDEGLRVGEVGKEGVKEKDEVKTSPEATSEMEKMSNKVMQLERECYMMRREIEKKCIHKADKEKEKVSKWKEMKRKFGCAISSGIHDCNCQVKKKKKVHPK